MKQVKVFVEKAEFGYSAYMEEAGLDYGCTGEGKTVEEAIHDFKESYAGIRAYYARHGNQEYVKAFSLAGLERITGVNQTQLGHYLHGRSKPSRSTVERIQRSVQEFARNLLAVRFA